MVIFKERVERIIINSLKEHGITVNQADGIIGITDWTDIDYPVDYEIRMERI